MISLLITVLIILVLLYVANLVIAELGLPQPVKTIAFLIIGLVFLFWLLNSLGVYHIS